MFEAFVNWIVVLPEPIKAAIALGVLYLVRLALSGRVPEAFLTELAAVLTAFLVAIINLLLGLIPLQWEAIATAILQAIAILLGGIFGLRVYLLARSAVLARGIRF